MLCYKINTRENEENQVVGIYASTIWCITAQFVPDVCTFKPVY